MKRNFCLKFKAKKGNAVIDVATVLVVLLVFVMCTFIGNYLLSEFNDDVQNDTTFDNETKAMVADQESRYPSLFDGLFVFLFCLLWMLVIVASFMIDSHPIFFGVTVLLLLFVFIAAAYLGNYYEEFIALDEFSGMENDYPMTDWILTHYLLVAIAIGFSIVVVLFGKNRMGR